LILRMIWLTVVLDKLKKSSSSIDVSRIKL